MTDKSTTSEVGTLLTLELEFNSLLLYKLCMVIVSLYFNSFIHNVGVLMLTNTVHYSSHFADKETDRVVLPLDQRK